MVLMLVPWTLFLVMIYPFLLVEASVRVMVSDQKEPLLSFLDLTNKLPLFYFISSQ